MEYSLGVHLKESWLCAFIWQNLIFNLRCLLSPAYQSIQHALGVGCGLGFFPLFFPPLWWFLRFHLFLKKKKNPKHDLFPQLVRTFHTEFVLGIGTALEKSIRDLKCMVWFFSCFNLMRLQWSCYKYFI